MRLAHFDPLILDQLHTAKATFNQRRRFTQYQIPIAGTLVINRRQIDRTRRTGVQINLTRITARGVVTRYRDGVVGAERFTAIITGVGALAIEIRPT